MSKVYIDKADVEYGEKSYEAAKKILTKANFKVKITVGTRTDCS